MDLGFGLKLSWRLALGRSVMTVGVSGVCLRRLIGCSRRGLNSLSCLIGSSWYSAFKNNLKKLITKKIIKKLFEKNN